MPDEPSVRLRDAIEADIPALSELHVRTFGETHGGGPTRALREQQWRSKFDSGQLVFCLVLEDQAGDLIGFASGELHEGDALREYRGELNKIYLLRAWHRRGLGRRLLCAAAARFRVAGVNSMLLFGQEGSPSNGFYEAMGGERLHAPNGEFHGGYGWADLAAMRPQCDGSLRAPGR